MVVLGGLPLHAVNEAIDVDLSALVVDRAIGRVLTRACSP